MYHSTAAEKVYKLSGCTAYVGSLMFILSVQIATAQFPSERFTKSDDVSTNISVERKQIILNSGEELFAEIR